MNFLFLWKLHSATYQMNLKFIRINIMLSKNRSNQTEKFYLLNNAKNLNFFFFLKKRLRKDFLLDGFWFLYLWTLQKCKKLHSNIIRVSNLMWDSSAPHQASKASNLASQASNPACQASNLPSQASIQPLKPQIGFLWDGFPICRGLFGSGMWKN